MGSSGVRVDAGGPALRAWAENVAQLVLCWWFAAQAGEGEDVRLLAAEKDRSLGDPDGKEEVVDDGRIHVV